MKYLVKNKMKDAEILYDNNRLSTSVYIAGYSVEIALKYKICTTLNFSGFPETRQELTGFLNQVNQNNVQQLRLAISDIRNHDLSKLLFYSGIEYRIKNNLFGEWGIVNTWNPENRYKKMRVLKKGSGNYIKSAKRIIREIM